MAWRYASGMATKMNFLPDENKIFLKKEYIRRLFALFGFGFFIIVLIGIVLLLFPFLSLKVQQKIFESQLLVSEKRLSSNNINDILPVTEDLNKKILIFEEIPKDSIEKSSIVRNIINRKTSAIKISSIFFDKEKDKEKITIRGVAERRDDMLYFIDSLKAEKLFKKVELPVSSLLKDKDVDFAINIEL